MPLTDKVAVIVGATGQLGPAVAGAFADAGCRLVLVGTQEEGLQGLFRELGFPESRVIIQVADALSDVSMKELAETVKQKFGRIDILLHLVGGYRPGGIRDASPALWDFMLNLNLRTAVNSLAAFVPLLTENRWGRIITISSGVTQSPPAASPAYVAAKAALEALTLSVAQDVKEFGVTANVVLIRALDTPSERAKQPEKKTGWVKPEDVAATLLFLCSDHAGAINGARIPVYG